MTTTPTELRGLAAAVATTNPKFLVSYSFQAPDATAAQAATDAVREAMQTSDALPVFDDLAFHAPVQVTDVPTAPWAKSIALILDSGEQSDLMAALMDAIEEGDPERRAEYRALADKLSKVIRASR